MGNIISGTGCCCGWLGCWGNEVQCMSCGETYYWKCTNFHKCAGSNQINPISEI